MRVSFPHLGHAVDFVVSMTFFRSAVFAIFAIQSLLTAMCRPKAAVLPGNWGVSLWDDQRTPAHLESAPAGSTRPNQPDRIHPRRSGCTVLASRILHELQPRGRTEASILDSSILDSKTLGRDVRLRCSTKKTPASLRGWLSQLTFLLAGSRQIRNLRAIAGAIGYVQRPRPRARRGWREHHF